MTGRRLGTAFTLDSVRPRKRKIIMTDMLKTKLRLGFTYASIILLIYGLSTWICIFPIIVLLFKEKLYRCTAIYSHFRVFLWSPHPCLLSVAMNLHLNQNPDYQVPQLYSTTRLYARAPSIPRSIFDREAQ